MAFVSSTAKFVTLLMTAGMNQMKKGVTIIFTAVMEILSQGPVNVTDDTIV